MKKVLSFVLSVAMVICLMPVMAFAADETAPASDTTQTTVTETAPATDTTQATGTETAPATDTTQTTGTETATGLSQFSDAGSITNEKKEAVAVLVGLGIIDGMGDGTFQPQGNLTRAQASKLVATLVKSGDKSDIPAPAEAPFTDVAKDYWGAGAIQFGVENGYINGMGDGTFHPEDQVTTAQLATMLCKVLGFAVDDINYHWPENAMAKANEKGLLIDINKGASDSLNREEAARMIFSALKACTVVKNTTTGSDNQLVDGGSDYDPVANKLSQDYRNPAVDSVQQLIEKYFPNATFVKNHDDFGRESTVWKNGKEDMTEEVTKAPVYSYNTRQVDELTAKWPAGVATKTLKDDLDGYVAEDAYIIRNGEVVTHPVHERDADGNDVIVNRVTYLNEDFSEYLANAISQHTGNGIEVELYANEKDTHIEYIIIVDYNVDMVKAVSSKTGDITLEDNGVIDKSEDYYSAISTVAKGDFVLVASNSEGIVDAYLPTAIDGVAVTKLTSVSKNGREDAVATIGGKEYSLGHDSVVYEDPYGGLDRGLNVNADDLGTVFLDKFDNVVAYRSVKLPDWALMKSVYRVDSYNDLGEAIVTWYAQLIKEDGSVDNVPLLYITDQDNAGYNTSAARETRETVGTFMNSAIVDSGEHNWFSQAGVVVNFTETAAGYRLNRRNSASEGVNSPRTIINSSYNGGTKLVDGKYYFADQITVIKVTGRKSSTIQVTTADKIDQTYDPGSYKYVAKRLGSGNSYQITTIYITGSSNPNDTNKVVKVTKILSSSASGSEVRYYTDDSDVAQEILVANSDVQPGFYWVERIEEGMFLVEDFNGEDHLYNFFDKTLKPGDDISGVKTILQLGETYNLTSDATIVDLNEGEIETVSDLVGYINDLAKEPVNSRDLAPLHISFAYDVADDGTRTTKQVYIEK